MHVRELNVAGDATAAAAALALQRLAYRAEADLIGRDDIPPLWEDLDGLRACGETFVAAFGEPDALIGFVSYKVAGDTLDVHRLVVHPSHVRRGIATALVEATVGCARAAGCHHVTVSTASANQPAVVLYTRLGFARVEELEVVPGFLISRFRRALY